MSLRVTNTSLSSSSSSLPFFSSRLYSPPTAANPSRRHLAMAQSTVRIAVVGDVHGDWDLEEDGKALRFLQHGDWDLEEDGKALRFLQADMVLFTGDFGNEDVHLVRSISNLEIQKAAILGNHDAWHTSQFSPRKTDRVELQLQCLKEQHVGYHRLDFPPLGLSIVGGRPFSCGGDRIFRRGLLHSRYGVQDMEGSAQKIYQTALGTPEGYNVIILAHNGPAGLGSGVDDICGRDWLFEGGDHGDADLAQAIFNLKKDTRLSVPLVVFGHMHKALAHGRGLRKMIVIGDDGTIYLNGAIVPRVKHFSEQGSSFLTSGSNQNSVQDPNFRVASQRAFTIIEMQDNIVKRISETWVAVIGNKSEVAKETVLFGRLHSELTSQIL